MILLSLFLACDSLLWPPLEEGSYELELVALVSDTCGYSDDDVGVGQQMDVELRWDNEVIIMESEAGEGQYLWTGEGFEAIGYSEVAVDDTCVLVVDATYTGQTFDRQSFGLIEAMSLSVTGDCSNWDTSMMPCETEVAWEGHLTE